MRQLCQLRQAKQHKIAVERASVELLEKPQLVAIDDDFDLDGIAHDPDIVEQRCQDCSIRKFARKSERYIDAYRPKAGDVRLTPAQVEYAVKKYRSHRKIPEKILEDLE